MSRLGRSFDDLIRPGPGDPRRAVLLLRLLVIALQTEAEAGRPISLSPSTVFVLKNRTVTILQAAGGGVSAYTPPEEIEPEAFAGSSAPAGVYSLGMMLYCFLRGRDAFQQEFAGYDGSAWFKWHAAPQRPQPPFGQAPPELAALVARMIERDPAKRPATYGELLIEVDALSGTVAVRKDWFKILFFSGAGLCLVLGFLQLFWGIWNSKPPDEIVTDAGIMRLVPGGGFLIGSERAANERPSHKVNIADVYVDKFEVTIEQYRRFAERNNRPLPVFPPDYPAPPTHPVWNVSWSDAEAYCAGSGRRLPTGDEWEHAARGPGETEYPWGNGPPSEDAANVEKSSLAAVGSFFKDRSAYGVYDLAGNLPEWVADTYRPYAGNGASPPAEATGEKTVRGGGYYLPWSFARASSRVSMPARLDPGQGAARIGFRCACEVAKGLELKR